MYFIPLFLVVPIKVPKLPALDPYSPFSPPFMRSSSSSSSSWAVAASIVCLLGLVFHFLCFVWFRFVVFAYEVRNLTKRGKQLH